MSRKSLVVAPKQVAQAINNSSLHQSPSGFIASSSLS